MASGDYSKTQYNNGAPPAINATNLNHIENKVDELDTSMLAAETTISSLVASDAVLTDFRAYDATRAYAINEPTFYLGVPYKSLTAANTGNTPSTSPTYWEVTGGGSGSATNVGYNFDNGQFETHTIGWTRGKSASAGVLPVGDGTGGSPNASTTFLRNTTTPINGLGDAILSKDAANRQGENVYYDFTIDRGQTTSPAQITFTYKTPVAYTDGMLGVFLYDKTNGALIRMSVENIPATYGSISQFLTTFIPSNSLEYRLIFHVITDTTTEWTFEVDNIQVGQKNVAVGAAIGNSIAFTCSITNLSGYSTQYSQYTRRGNYIEVSARFLKDGTAGVGTSNLLFSIPTGLSIDYSIMAAFSGCGTLEITDSVSYRDYSVAAVNGAGVLARGGGAVTNNIRASDIIANATFGITFSVPIAQWTSNVNMASDFTEYVSNSNTADAEEAAFVPANNVLGSGGSLFPNISAGIGTYTRHVKFSRPIQATDTFEVDFYSSDGWVPLDIRLGTMQRQGSYLCGLRVERRVDPYVVAVMFGRNGYEFTTGSYAGVSTSTWASLFAAGFRWRVRKVSNGNMAEVPPVVRAEYYGKSAQTCTNGSTVNIIYTTKREDTHSGYNTTTGGYTFPIDGVYQINARFVIASYTTNYTDMRFNITAGGTTFCSQMLSQNAAGFVGCFVNGSIRAKAGDIVFLSWSQISGASRDTLGGATDALHGVTITRIGS